MLDAVRIKRFLSACQMLVLAVLGSVAAVAQEIRDEAPAQEESQVVVPLTVEDKLSLDQSLQKIDDDGTAIKSLKIDVSDVRDKINVDISEAASRSVFLDLAIDQAGSLRASVAILPDNAELAGELRAADARVKLGPDKADISISFPQPEVHVYESCPTAA